MKILYVAKHGNGFNDDEGAIEYALGQLGHTVVSCHEGREDVVKEKTSYYDFDFCLFHKWHNFEAVKNLPIPKVFWYFDLVNTPDVTLRRRCYKRKTWMKQMIPLVDLGFCTDGDWVNQDKTGKLIRLTQGADERFVGALPRETRRTENTILFTGIKFRAGVERYSFCKEMEQTYGHKFIHKSSRYQNQLAHLISRTSIVVAPDYPVTDNYWSNRVYMACGFGAFMLHSYCETLTEHYEDCKEIYYYKTRIELHNLIRECLDPEVVATTRYIATNALERTKKEHLYRHRCETLIEHVKERIL